MHVSCSGPAHSDPARSGHSFILIIHCECFLKSCKSYALLKNASFPSNLGHKREKIENHIVEIEIPILQFLKVVIYADLCLEDSLYGDFGNRRKQSTLIPV